MALELLLPVPGSVTKWCAIFQSNGSYYHERMDLTKLIRAFYQRHPQSGLQIRKIEAIHGDRVCAIARKPNGKEVLLLLVLSGTMRYKELLTLDTKGSWRSAALTEDATGVKVFLIEGGRSGDHEVVLLFESRTQAWRVLCTLPVAMARYLHQLPSVGIGSLLYVLVQQGGSRLRRSVRIAALDFGRNEWLDYDVVTPRDFSRLQLVRVQERLVLVGVQHGSSIFGRYFVMEIDFVTGSRPQCVEVSEMPGVFGEALAFGDGDGGLTFQSAVRGYRDSVFFMSPRGRPVVYSTTKNAWNHVPGLNEMQNPKAVSSSCSLKPMHQLKRTRTT